jgi:ABC-type phosphate/phosphonate transport system substrate-binding protein
MKVTSFQIELKTTSNEALLIQSWQIDKIDFANNSEK